MEKYKKYEKLWKNGDWENMKHMRNYGKNEIGEIRTNMKNMENVIEKI